MSDNESPSDCGRRVRREPRLHHNPKHFQMRELKPSEHTHTLARFHIPLLHKHVVSRSKVSINNNALQSEMANSVRGRRHLRGAQEVVLIDAVQKCLFSSKAWSFYQAFVASTSRRLGSPDALKIPLTSYYAAQNERRDNPRHLYSHLSTHIHITKGVCARESSFA